MRDSKSSSVLPIFSAAVLLTALSAAAIWFFHGRGEILGYGDANAHLNIARRILDSRTPGYEQIGTVWLPLPHVLTMPFVANDYLWRTGLAGAIPMGLSYIAAGVFLFLSARRLGLSAWTALALFALNPNLLYLQSIPLNESLMAACLAATLYFTIRQMPVAAGFACLAGTMTRYDGWFLLPFVALYFWRRMGLAAGLRFGLIAGAGPAYWLAHNYYFYGNALDFYNGPWSAKGIQGGRSYPGLGDWRMAAYYYSHAIYLNAGAALYYLGFGGALVAVIRRKFWPVLLLALPGLFYVVSMHGQGNPIYMPDLWPFSHYNTRYGIAMLPFLALGGAALAVRPWVGPLITALALAPWAIKPGDWIVRNEAYANSKARIEWTRRAAAYLGEAMGPGDGVFSTFSDVTGVLREAGVPFVRTLNECDGLFFEAACQRPDLFLHERWAIALRGDAVSRALSGRPDYECVKIIEVRDAPAVEIYRRARR